MTEGTPTHHEWDTQKIAHRRMIVRPRRIGEFVRQIVANNVRIIRHVAEKTVPHGRMADEFAGHRLDSRVDQLNRISSGIKDGKCAIARSREGDG